MAVRTGLDRIASGEGAVLAGKRFALIANPSAVDQQLRHAADVLAESGGTLSALFGPEHGIRGDAQDMIAVGDAPDATTGLPVYSLYGHDEASLAPRAEWLDGLDAVVFDIQDIGARYYTYVWTMVYAMRACAAAGLEMIVLDRPNPLGGVLVEGGAVTPRCRSFVGLHDVPNRHGLTAAEIARMARQREQLDVELTCMEMTGWRRDMQFADTGLPWVMPSPNMPTYDTALVYPGMCLIEGTDASEARGTTRPFELFGAPYVDPNALCGALAAEDLPGVRFRPTYFLPQFQKHAGVQCGGAQMHVTDGRAFRPYLTGVAVLRALRQLYPDDFSWREKAYEFVDAVPAIDLLAGSSEVREGVDRGDSLADIAATWSAAEAAFVAARTAWLLYS